MNDVVGSGEEHLQRQGGGSGSEPSTSSIQRRIVPDEDDSTKQQQQQQRHQQQVISSPSEDLQTPLLLSATNNNSSADDDTDAALVQGTPSSSSPREATRTSRRRGREGGGGGLMMMQQPQQQQPQAENGDLLLLPPENNEQQHTDDDETAANADDVVVVVCRGHVQPPAFRDAWCAVLFHVQCLAMLVAAISLGPLVWLEEQPSEQQEQKLAENSFQDVTQENSNNSHISGATAVGHLLQQLLPRLSIFEDDDSLFFMMDKNDFSNVLAVFVSYTSAVWLFFLTLVLPAGTAMVCVVQFYTLLARRSSDNDDSDNDACHKLVTWSFWITPGLYWTAAILLLLLMPYDHHHHHFSNQVVGLLGVAVVWTVAAAAHWCWYRRSIPFAAANLQVALQALTTMTGSGPSAAANNPQQQRQGRFLPQPLTLLVGLSLVAQVVLCVYWCIAVVALAGLMAYLGQMAVPCDRHDYRKEDDGYVCYDSTPSVWWYILWALCVFWTHSVIHNVLRTTTAGTVGSWWFAVDGGSGEEEAEEGLSLVATTPTATSAATNHNTTTAPEQESLLHHGNVNTILDDNQEEEDPSVREALPSSGGCCGCCQHADVCDSLYRSMTFSFGSICFGSLLVALVQAVYLLLGRVVTTRQEQRRRNTHTSNCSLLFCCLDGLLQFLARLVDYFNAWSFTYVGLYGYNYLTAGRKVHDLWQARGWSSVITDRLLYRVLTYVKWGIGAVTGCLCVLATQVLLLFVASSPLDHDDEDGNTTLMGDAGGGGTSSTDDNDDDAIMTLLLKNKKNVSLTLGLLGALVGVVLADVSFRIVESAVRTILVCLAESTPEQAALWHPAAYAVLQDGWQQSYPEEWQQQQQHHHQYVLMDEESSSSR